MFSLKGRDLIELILIIVFKKMIKFFVRYPIFILLLVLSCQNPEQSKGELAPPDARIIEHNTIDIQDNVSRVIFDYSIDTELGLNQMKAPAQWTEPFIEIDFELRGIVLNGTLGLEFADTTLRIKKNNGFHIPKGSQLRIFNAGIDSLHLIEVLRPAYQESLVRKLNGFE